MSTAVSHHTLHSPLIQSVCPWYLSYNFFKFYYTMHCQYNSSWSTVSLTLCHPMLSNPTKWYLLPHCPSSIQQVMSSFHLYWAVSGAGAGSIRHDILHRMCLGLANEALPDAASSQPPMIWPIIYVNALLLVGRKASDKFTFSWLLAPEKRGRTTWPPQIYTKMDACLVYR